MADYSVKFLEIGRVENCPMEFFLCEYANDEIVTNPWGITLIEGEGKKILVDTGIDVARPEKEFIAKICGVSNYHTVPEVLATVGVKPEEIDAVFITHIHIDHTGSVDNFPNAIFYIQDEELSGWQKVMDEPKKYSAVSALAFDPDDAVKLLEIEKAGRLVRLSGDKDDVIPGISVRKMSFGHTFAPEVILVETAKGQIVIAGDAANRPENFLGTKDHPYYIPNRRFCVGSPFNLASDFDKLLELCGQDLSKIVMTHDCTKGERAISQKESELGLNIVEIA